jgi:beta-glucosidase
MRLSDAELKQVRHRAVLGHCLAVEAIRARAPAGTRVGFAENIRVAVPVIDEPAYVAAAEATTRERNAGFSTVMLEGRCTDAYLSEAGGETPRLTDDELRTIASPLDFVGINVYRPGWYVEPSDEAPATARSRSTRRTRGCSPHGTCSILNACLGQLQRATSDRIPVDGYFLWSAQDNFEWVDGYGNRFGLIYVDFDTLARTPKLSAEWFQHAARQNAVG